MDKTCFHIKLTTANISNYVNLSAILLSLIYFKSDED